MRRATWKCESEEDNIKMNSSDMVCEDGRWMELDHDHVRWWALLLEILNFQVLLTEG